MRISSAQIFQQALNALNERSRDLAQTQNQLATGLRITRPADDPGASARVLGLNDSIARLAQYQRNADAGTARLELTDDILDQVGDGLNRANTLTLQGLNDTNSPADRQTLAVELGQIRDAMLDLANSRDANGEYVFAGSRSSQAAFTDTGAGVAYNGDQSPRELAISDGRRIANGLDGQSLFMKVPADGGGFQDVFTTLDNLIADLETGVAPDSAELTNLQSALDVVLTGRARVGASLNAIDAQRQVNDTLAFQDEVVRSGLRDLDIAEAASRFAQQVTTLEAAQQSFVRVQGLSLFNFL